MNDPKVHKLYYFSGFDNVGKFVEINGVNNLSVETTISFAENHSLGGSDLSNQINAPDLINISFDRSLVENDPFFQFTGKDPIKNVFIYNGLQYLKLDNIYLKSYSASFSVGSFPKVSTTFVSYSEGIKQVSELSIQDCQFANYATYNGNPFIPKMNAISITGYNGNDSSLKFIKKNIFTDEDIHNIYAFNLSVEINRIPYYSIGCILPVEVSQILPLQMCVSIDSKASSKYKDDLFPAYFSQSEDYLNFSLQICDSDKLIKYPITKAKLNSSSIEYSSSSVLNIRRNFIGHYGI